MRAPAALVLLCCLALLGAGGLWLAWWLDESAAVASVPDREAETRPKADPLALAPEANDRTRVERTEASEAIPNTAEGAMVRGRVVVRGATGWQTPPATGEIELLVGVADDMNERVLPVIDGRFEFPRPDGGKAHCSVSRLELGGRLAWCSERFECTADEDLVVRADWYMPVFFRVVDATTHLELSRVRIVLPNWETEGHLHPGTPTSSQFIVRSGTSPVQLDIDEELLDEEPMLWVGAEGYGWTQVAIDFRIGGEQRIELHPESILEVHVEGEVPKEWWLRIRKPFFGDIEELIMELDEEPDDVGADPEASLADADVSTVEDIDVDEELRNILTELHEHFGSWGDLVLELKPRPDQRRIEVRGLSPGAFAVGAEQGEWYDNPLIWAEEYFTLEEGATTAVTLRLAAPPPLPDPVPLGGTFFLHPAWGGQPALHVESLDILGDPEARERSLVADDFTPVPGSAGLFLWDAGLVIPGSYELSYDPMGLSLEIEVGPTGRQDVEFSIEAPVRLATRVIDENGEVIPDLRLCWEFAERPYDGSFDIEWDPATRTYPCEALPAAIVLTISNDEWSPVDEDEVHHLRSGDQQLTLRARRNCGIRIRAEYQGVPAPVLDELWDSEARCLAGQGEETSWNEDDLHYVIVLSAPGSYEVVFPVLPGYQPVAPETVQVPTGKFVELVLRLQK